MWRKKEKNGLFSKDVVMVCFSRDKGYVVCYGRSIRLSHGEVFIGRKT